MEGIIMYHGPYHTAGKSSAKIRRFDLRKSEKTHNQYILIMVLHIILET